MTTEEAKALPLVEKIRIMEAIWEDFRERFERMEISQEQKDLLDQRRARVPEGKAGLLDWDSVKEPWLILGVTPQAARHEVHHK